MWRWGWPRWRGGRWRRRPPGSGGDGEHGDADADHGDRAEVELGVAEVEGRAVEAHGDKGNTSAPMEGNVDEEETTTAHGGCGFGDESPNRLSVQT